MDRPLLSLTLSCSLLLPLLAGSACKKGEEKKAAPEAKTTEPIKVAEAVPTSEEGPVKADRALIDKSLEALADATLTQAGKEGDAGGLPPIKSDSGISCGVDPVLSEVLAHIGFDNKSLKAGAGFRFADVCIGWRPYIKPRTEMYYMISAGEESKETGLLEHRRCIRVRTAEGAFHKDAIMDGPCLELHRKAWAAAAEDAKVEEAAKAEESAKAAKSK